MPLSSFKFAEPIVTPKFNSNNGKVFIKKEVANKLDQEILINVKNEVVKKCKPKGFIIKKYESIINDFYAIFNSQRAVDTFIHLQKCNAFHTLPHEKIKDYEKRKGSPILELQNKKSKKLPYARILQRQNYKSFR